MTSCPDTYQTETYTDLKIKKGSPKGFPFSCLNLYNKKEWVSA
jgi:hypothetical protein